MYHCRPGTGLPNGPGGGRCAIQQARGARLAVLGGRRAAVSLAQHQRQPLPGLAQGPAAAP